MKKCISMFAVTSLVSGVAFADMYYDPTGDIATGNANLDITQVEITDNGVDLFITVSLSALDGDWGKYMMFIDAWEGGSGDNDNPCIHTSIKLEKQTPITVIGFFGKNQEIMR